MRILITGGAGFIGSAVARKLIRDTDHSVTVFDKLTYAGSLASLVQIAQCPRFAFVRGDICDVSAVRQAIEQYAPHVVMNLAAESHVDRSIETPDAFVRTNVLGTCVLLQACAHYWGSLPASRQRTFRFVHISTDEVYGSLGPSGMFTEHTPYAPTSPYSASKASSDHLVRAWYHTYGLPTIITNCSNNYGPYHFPEKLIPLTILNALEGRALPVYGRGENIRDWLYVEDHADALVLAAVAGAPGESYNIGANCERRNIDVVHRICDMLDELVPEHKGASRRRLVTFVDDRPGHDHRYSIDASKIRDQLGWRPTHSFEGGLRQTILWFLENRKWWEVIRSGVYDGARLGILAKAS